jgi:uroporphyrinogen III methyltransferase/synthase
LITLRGVELLRRADVVLYDYLVNPRILQHAPSHADCICLGRHGATRIWSQAEINAEMVALASQGRTVVRLKGGDPAVFARSAEEVETLARHGIPFEIVPGITAALAAGSYAGIPITHREHASAVALVTGHEIGSKTAPQLDYASLARFPGTLVVYMGATTALTWTRAFIDQGMSPETPAMIVRRCSLPNQQSVRCTLSEVAEHFTGPQRMRPPVVVMLGAVAALPPQWAWFEQRPLFGQKILVTRPAHQATELSELLEDAGGEVLLQPAIAIREPSAWMPVDAALSRLDQFQWLVFSSANGVHSLLQRLAVIGRDLRALGAIRLAAIGPATAAALQTYHLRADQQPARYQAEDLAELLAAEALGTHFLLARASRGREVLAERLTAAGGKVTQIVVYESVDVSTPEPDIAAAMCQGDIHWTTVTSSAIARSLHQLFARDLAKTRLASISPITSATLRELGWEPTVEAREATMSGVVEAILSCEI